MIKALLICVVAAAMFPYTQILPSDSYTQPYALLLAVASTFFCFRTYVDRAPGWDALSLLGLAFLGATMFSVSCLPAPSAQDFKSLLMYVSPLFFSVSAFSLASVYPATMRRIVTVAAVIWLSVGIVQVTVDPAFATRWVGDWREAAEAVVSSGRGVIGLAPEPTHYGFHLLVVAGVLYLLGGSRRLSLACVLAAVAIARSSSAVLALAIGAGGCLLIRPVKMLVPVMASVACAVVVFGMLSRSIGEDPIRLASLMTAFLENPTAILLVDASVNLRLGGLAVGMGLVADSWWWPHGLSNADWLARLPAIREANPWLFDISASGIPSGIVIVAYQSGWMGMLLLAAPLLRIVRAARSPLGLWLVISAIAVFLGQYLISSPGFGVLHGCAVAATVRARTAAGASSINSKENQ